MFPHAGDFILIQRIAIASRRITLLLNYLTTKIPQMPVLTNRDHPPVRRELQGVQFDHGHYVPLVVIGHLLHTSILGQPHATLGAGQAGGGRRGRCEGV